MSPCSSTSRVVRTAFLLSYFVPALSAQTIRGRVVQPDSVTAVAGATIVVRDSAGTVVGRVASATDGRYSMRLPGPGRYDLQSIRIGFGPVQLPLGGMARGEDRVLTLVMAERPLELAAVDVQGDDRCRMSRNDRARFVQLWQQARAALGPHVSELGGGFAMRVLTVEGLEDGPLRLPGGDLVWNPNDRHPEVDSSKARESYTDTFLARTPFTALAARGYVRRQSDDSWVHEVPNPEAILSEEFLASYCFGLDGGPPGRGDWVGLTFRPIVDADSVTDIDGTLYLDKVTAELRRVDFSYRNLPRAPFINCLSTNRPVGLRRGEARYGPYCREPYSGGWRPRPPLGTGGTLEFAHVGPGAWVVSDWIMRMRGEEFMDRFGGYQRGNEFRQIVPCNDRPTSQCRRVYYGVPRLIVSSGAVASLMHDGVELYRGQSALEAMTRVAAMQAGRNPSHIAGTVADAEGRPVSGALITIESPSRAIRTDSLGRFEIATLPAGDLILRIGHEDYVDQTMRVTLKARVIEEIRVTLTAGAPNGRR